MGKLKRKRAIDLIAQLNWQISQEERRIRERCSFFAYVGSAEAFRAPRQITGSLQADAARKVRVPRSAQAKPTGRSHPTNGNVSARALA